MIVFVFLFWCRVSTNYLMTAFINTANWIWELVFDVIKTEMLQAAISVNNSCLLIFRNEFDAFDGILKATFFLSHKETSNQPINQSQLGCLFKWFLWYYHCMCDTMSCYIIYFISEINFNINWGSYMQLFLDILIDTNIIIFLKLYYSWFICFQT